MQRKGENVVLVDAGDHVQGTALGGYDEGRSIIDIMSAAGYDAATLGNHEFDYGIATLFRNLTASVRSTVVDASANDPSNKMRHPRPFILVGTP